MQFIFVCKLQLKAESDDEAKVAHTDKLQT
jgi:hypothetical protein